MTDQTLRATRALACPAQAPRQRRGPADRGGLAGPDPADGDHLDQVERRLPRRPLLAAAHPTFKPYLDVWNGLGFDHLLWNSVLYATFGSALAVLLGLVPAYALARFPVPGKRWIFGILLTGMMLPQQTVLIPLYNTLRALELLDTRFGLIVVHGVYGMPMQILALRAFMTTIPREIEKAAYLEGATDWQVFRQIILPLSLPGIVVGFTLNFIAIWKEFVFGLVFLNSEGELPADCRHAQAQQRPLHLGLQPAGRRPRDLADPDRHPVPAHLPQALRRQLRRRRQGLTRPNLLAPSIGTTPMAAVSLIKVDKRFGRTQVIENLNLDIADGEFTVLVGPSGCGKSTTLQMVAGLESISAGQLMIGGRDVTELPPKSRDISMVFQSYALFPHMNVRDNIAFGLKLRKTPAADIERQVAAWPSACTSTACSNACPRRFPAGSASVSPWPARWCGSRRLPDGRAAVQPRRQVARGGAKLPRQDAPGAAHDDDLRHPRPGRSDDDGQQDRRHERGRDPAGGAAAAGLQRAGEPLRGQLHRLAGDELHGTRLRGRLSLRCRVRAATGRAGGRAKPAQPQATGAGGDGRAAGAPACCAG